MGKLSTMKPRHILVGAAIYATLAFFFLLLLIAKLFVPANVLEIPLWFIMVFLVISVAGFVNYIYKYQELWLDDFIKRQQKHFDQPWGAISGKPTSLTDYDIKDHRQSKIDD